MPRLSAKRSCLSFMLVAIIFFVYLSWPESPREMLPNRIPPNRAAKVVEKEKNAVEEKQHTTKEKQQTTKKGQTEDSSPETTSFPDYTEEVHSVEVTGGKPWFVEGGTLRPTPPEIGSTGRRIASLWPQERPDHDRIIDQLMFVPRQKPDGVKIILMYNGISSWGPLVSVGSGVFRGCPVNTCALTANRVQSKKADAIIYKDQFSPPGHPRPPKQVWIVYMLECPYHTQHFKYNDLFNWTATYRRDSDIVTPYEKWVYYDERVKQLKTPIKNFAANKTKQVAWFVSNCGARNGRLQYARELQKYIGVDIFGACGSKKCPRKI